MLVLSRKISEAIKIGDNIVVKVIAIRGGQVKLGIDAPPGVRVIRTEPHGAAETHGPHSPDRSGSSAVVAGAKDTKD